MLILYNVMLFVVSFFSVFISGIYISTEITMNIYIKYRIIRDIFMYNVDITCVQSNCLAIKFVQSNLQSITCGYRISVKSESIIHI